MIANACLFFSNKKIALYMKRFTPGNQGNLVGLDKMFVDFDLVIQKRMDTKIKRTIISADRYI